MNPYQHFIEQRGYVSPSFRERRERRATTFVCSALALAIAAVVMNVGALIWTYALLAIAAAE